MSLTTMADLGHHNKKRDIVRFFMQNETKERIRCGVGLPPEKWSSLMYGLWPDGGLKNGKEATHCGRDRHEAAAG